MTVKIYITGIEGWGGRHPLTNGWGLYNYVDVVPVRLCWKDTEDGSRGT